MADEPRSYLDPDLPLVTPPGTGEPQILGPGTTQASLPPQLKGDDGLAVDYDGYAYVIRMDLSEALVIAPEGEGLWTPVWRQADGRFYRVDFTSLHARLTAQDQVIATSIAQGLEDNRTTLLNAQNAFEAAVTTRQEGYETALTTRQDSFEQNELAARTGYQTALTARQGDFEDAQIAARSAFEAAQTERQDSFEEDELAARASFEQGINTALGLQDQRMLTLETTFASYQGEVDGQLATFQSDTNDALDAMDLRVTEAERIANEALANVQQTAVPDGAVTFPKLAADVEAMVRDKSWASLTDVPATFAPSPHRHQWTDLDGKPATFAPSLHRHSWADLDNVPALFPAYAHHHVAADIDDLQPLLDDKGSKTGANTWLSSQTFRMTAAQPNNQYIERPAGQTAYFTFRTGTSNRWQFGVDSSAESGANAGTKFVIKRSDDTGASLDTPVEIDRKTGAVKLTQRPSWAGYTPWDSNNFNPATKADAASLAGMVAYFPTTTAPAGWLKANGAVVSRTTYAALFAVIGTAFNTGGEAATDFRLPDLRGEFLRGLDDGRGIDVGRALGSSQAGDVGPHGHTATTTITAAGAHNHTVVDRYGVINTTADGSYTGRNSGSAERWLSYTDVTKATNTEPAHTHPAATTVNDSTGAETRPRNVALLACIKY